MTVTESTNNAGIPDQVSDYDVVVFNRGGLTHARYARDDNGAVVAPNSDFSVVMQAAINAKTLNKTWDIYVQPRFYTASSTINLLNYVRIRSNYQSNAAVNCIQKASSFTGTDLFSHSDVGSGALLEVVLEGLALDGVDESIDGIDISGYNCKIKDCQVTNSANAIHFQAGGSSNDDNEVSDCFLSTNDRAILGDASVPTLRIKDNWIGTVGKDAIAVNGFSHSIHDNKMWNWSVDSNGYYGILITNADGTIVHDNQLEPDNTAGNCIGATTTDDFSIHHNRMRTASAARNGIVSTSCTNGDISFNHFAYTSGGTFVGIKEVTAASGMQYSGNNFVGATFAGGNYTLVAVPNIFWDTTGFRGTGSIANGATTSGNIAHGCPYTPVASDFIIAATEQPTNAAGQLSVGSIDGTNFVVSRADPGASGLDFSWSIKRI